MQTMEMLKTLVLSAADTPISFEPLHMWRAMGLFAKGIAGVLAVMSVYSLAVMAERLVTYRRAAKASRQFALELRELLPDGRFGDAVALSRRLERGYLCKVLGLAIDEYERGLAAKSALGSFDVIEAVNRAVERSSVRVIAELRRGLGGLATVGSTAPFVGLLGTVAGIITAFQAMAATGAGGLGSVSAGIAEALVTTAFGLLVAIPAVMMFNYLNYRVEDMEVDITDAANELVDVLIKEGRHTTSRSEAGIRPPLRPV